VTEVRRLMQERSILRGQVVRDRGAYAFWSGAAPGRAAAATAFVDGEGPRGS
jgi:hypothetical protein